MDGMKQCSLCKDLKPFSEFGKDKNRKDGLTSWCSYCKNMKSRESKERNKDHESEYARKRYIKNPKRTRSYVKKWRAENPEAYHQQGKENSKKWRLLNPDRYKEDQLNSNARKAGIPGNIRIEEWNSLCKKYGRKCLKCGRSDIKLTIDHVIPLSLGGQNNIGNVQPLCLYCNQSKKNKIIDYRP